MTDDSNLAELLAGLRRRLTQVPGLDAAQLDEAHREILGRKSGELTAALKLLPQLAPEARRSVGAEANALRLEFEGAFEARRTVLRDEAARSATAGVDLTMPGRGRWPGGEHPATRVMEEILDIFRSLGFTIAVGPEAETEWYNFGALNFPADHPAMDMHDTLYLDLPPAGEEGRWLLRTHTSPVQLRAMMTSTPPIRVVAPGMVYRKDTFDPSHAPAFAQIEGLVVDEGISFVDLKSTLIHFARRFFTPETAVRFRPSYFPFTEPSAEMDVGCQLCGGMGCSACKGTGWMEILGCGMVHPSVLANGGIDPERYTGFAFGMGPQRIAMLRYGVPDIRLFYEGDMRFLSQFGGSADRRTDGSAGRRSGGSADQGPEGPSRSGSAGAVSADLATRRPAV
jgi:phenylalanyl-tRNA synthetase alpha chain